MIYVDLYKEKHNSKISYGRGATFLLPQISLFVDYLQARSILDYGCGKGDLVRALQNKYPTMVIRGYDPAVAEFSDLPKDKFDFIVCTDVLEHIPEDELIETVKRISNISQNVFFHLHHAKAGEILSNGENAHCTVKSHKWYYELFGKYFNKLQSLPGASYVNTACITFDIPFDLMLTYDEGIIDFLNQQANIQQIRLKQATALLAGDFSRKLLPNTVFYGYSKLCKTVLSKLHDKTNLIGIADRDTLLYSKGGDRCKEFKIPFLSLDDIKDVDNINIVVFPTWDFDNIVNNLKSVLARPKIYRAEEFFVQTSHTQNEPAIRCDIGGNF